MNLPLTQHLFRIAFLLTLLLPALLFAAPPAATTLTAPAGSLSDSQPVFSWDAVPNATWYKVWIERNGETYVKEWVQASTTWQPAANLPDGDYTWWVKTWNAEGNGPWSAPGAFQIAGNIPGAPGATTPISPSGLITNPQPTFSWNAVTNATWYKVWIDKDGAKYSADWIEGSTSWQPAEALLPGIYTWRVKTWGPNGTGPWSDTEIFVIDFIDSNLPAATSLLVPTGLITNPQPQFQWTAVENASWYKIQINRNGEVHTLEWINGATAWTPAADLPAGDYTWWVKTWNEEGNGPWSAEKTFTVAAAVSPHSDLEQQAHLLVNNYRNTQALSSLSWDETIAQVCRVHSQNMANGTVSFGHNGFQARVDQIGLTISWVAAGENVAWNQGYSQPADTAVDGWIGSPGHRANMVGTYNKTGIGVALSNNGKYYFTQIFILE